MDGIEGRIRKENRQKAILDIVAGAGILTLAMLTPGALSGVAVFRRHFKKRGDAHSTYRAFKRLKEKGYIRIEKSARGTAIALTERGQQHLVRMGLQKPPTPKHWDGHWRVVIYDIPEHKKAKRLLLKEALKNTGFHRLQDSVWIYPYPCEELVVLLKAEYQLGKEVLYMAVKHLENDRQLKEKFGIQK